MHGMRDVRGFTKRRAKQRFIDLARGGATSLRAITRLSMRSLVCFVRQPVTSCTDDGILAFDLATVTPRTHCGAVVAIASAVMQSHLAPSQTGRTSCGGLC